MSSKKNSFEKLPKKKQKQLNDEWIVARKIQIAQILGIHILRLFAVTGWSFSAIQFRFLTLKLIFAVAKETARSNHEELLTNTIKILKEKKL